MADQCNYDPADVGTYSKHLGIVSGFYSIAQGIVDGLQNEPSEKILQDVNDAIFGDGNVTSNQIISEVVKSQIGMIIFWSIGFLMMITALVLIIVTACCQCCSTCRPPEYGQRKTWSGILLLGLLAASFALVLMSLIVVDVAVSGIFAFVKNEPVSSTGFEKDLSVLMETGIDQFSCATDSTVQEFIKNFEKNSSAYPDNVINPTFDSLDITPLLQTDFKDYETTVDTLINEGNNVEADLQSFTSDDTCKTSAQNQATVVTLCLTTLKNFKSVLPQVQQAIVMFNENLDGVKESVNDQMSAVNDIFDDVNKSIQQIMNSLKSASTSIQQDVNTTVNAMDRAQDDFSQASEDYNLQTIVELSISIPLCLVLVFTLVTAFFIISSFLGAFSKKGAFPASFSIIFFYVTTVFSILTMIVASTLFVFGWATSAVCVPLFHDPTYRIFGRAHQTYAVPGMDNEIIDINVKSIMQQCSISGTTVFGALNGSTYYSPQKIDELAGFAGILQEADQHLEDIDFEFGDSPDFTTDVNALRSALSQIDTKDFSAKCQNSASTVALIEQFYSDTNDFLLNMDKLQWLIVNAIGVSQNGTLKATLKQNNDRVVDMEYFAFNTTLINLFDKLQNNVFDCSPGMKIYRNTGSYACDNFGQQLHGIWASIGLASLTMIPLAITFLFVYKWFHLSKLGRSSSVNSIYSHSHNINPPDWTMDQFPERKGLRRNY